MQGVNERPAAFSSLPKTRELSVLVFGLLTINIMLHFSLFVLRHCMTSAVFLKSFFKNTMEEGLFSTGD